MSTLNQNDKMNLKNLVASMGAEDNTENIRKWKHSTRIRDDIRILDTLTQESCIKYTQNTPFTRLL